MNWQAAEMLGYSYYANKGYRILVSLVKTHGYDFVAEKDGKFIRVNVKVAGLKDPKLPNSWSISQAGGTFYGDKKHMEPNCDVYLAYLPDDQKFIELPNDFFKNVKSKSRCIPRKLSIG